MSETRDISTGREFVWEEELHIFKGLVHDACYAIRSNNGDLVYETLGQARMAYKLGAITREEFRHIERALIPGWINNVRNRAELAETITEDDIMTA